MSDMIESVGETVEEIAVDAVIERQKEQIKPPPWETWVALSSSVLAVLSAVAALYATFAVDQASKVTAHEAVYAAYGETAISGLTVLRAKVDILQTLGKPASSEDMAAIRRFESNIADNKSRVNEADQQGKQKFQVHDRLAVSVTLFQVAILMGGLAVVIRRRSMWMFGMSFAAIASVMLAWGLFTF